MDKDNSLNDILKGCRSGNQQSYSQLVSLYSQKIYNYFLRLSNNQHLSEDLTSEVFLKVLENIKKLKSDNFSAWLFRIASNCFFDHLRQKQKQKNFLESQQGHLEQYTDQPSLEIQETQNLVQKELDKLDEQTKDLLILRFYGNLGFQEIADIKKMPIGTVLSKIHRSLKDMKITLRGAKNE